MSQNEHKKRLIAKLKAELGKEVLNALEDDSVIEIMLNSDNELWIDRLGEGMSNIPTHTCLAESAIFTVATFLKTNVTVDNPILECELPIDGSRFEALVPPIVSYPSFTLRKKAKQIFTLEEYISQGIISTQQKEAIKKAIEQHKNILIAGGTGSGKTTLTNAIIEGISNHTPNDRVIIIEDTAELQCSSKNKVIFRATEFVSMQRLLKATMRYRPDRILVGEVRGGEALTLLKAWNTGHPGGIATVHANNATAALTRMEQLVAEATIADSRAIISEAIDLVIYIEKTSTGRKIKEMLEVINYDYTQNKYNTRSLT